MEKTIKGTVILQYNKNGMRVFDLKTKHGDFRVLDYSYDPLDREVYWLRDTKIIRSGSEEYYVAEALVDGYIHAIYEKLSSEGRKNWPLV